MKKLKNLFIALFKVPVRNIGIIKWNLRIIILVKQEDNNFTSFTKQNIKRGIKNLGQEVLAQNRKKVSKRRAQYTTIITEKIIFKFMLNKLKSMKTQ